MNDPAILKKYKELLDNGVITQEDFDKKKSEILYGNPISSSENAESDGSSAVTTELTSEVPKKQSNKVSIRKIAIIICVLATLIGGSALVNRISETNKQLKRADALNVAIQPIMSKYGLDTYEVKYPPNLYHPEVYAEGFGSLRNGDALNLLKELDGVEIDDPCGNGKIDFGVMTSVHPGLDVEYSYWRVPSYVVLMNQQYGGNYKVPGIYCNQYGSECIFEWEN